MSSRFEAIRNKTQEVLDKAKALYGVDIKPAISFNLRGRVAGYAGWRRAWGNPAPSAYYLKFNQQMIAGNHFEDIRDETVPHEVAHLVCAARPELGKNHDLGWKRVCLALGGNGQTRHDYEVQYASGTFVYRATCGTEISLSKQKHQKVQNGAMLILRKTRGRITRDCAWARHGQPLPEKAVTAGTLPPVPSMSNVFNRPRMAAAAPASRPQTGGTSKAERVREFIRSAKQQNLDRGWAIQQAISALDMPRAQAIRYVTENWDRA